MDNQISHFLSPLRYPGGKASLSDFFITVLAENNIINGTYCEVYAGGAGAALRLLFSEKVQRIILNDADYHIYAFWSAILNNTEDFLKAIDKSKLTVSEWKKQRLIYSNPQKSTLFQVGFSTFYLNRCNRGGILPNAGPIGGFDQTGNYLIDARFNKENLKNRIIKIASKKDKIELYNLDAIDFIKTIKVDTQTLVYLDPPYYLQGQKLYLNFYNESDHQNIEKYLRKFKNLNWIVSYDNVPEINSIYDKYRKFPFDLNYSVQVSRKGKELMVFSNNLILPDYFILRKNKQELIYS